MPLAAEKGSEQHDRLDSVGCHNGGCGKGRELLYFEAPQWIKVTDLRPELWILEVEDTLDRV